MLFLFLLLIIRIFFFEKYPPKKVFLKKCKFSKNLLFPLLMAERFLFDQLSFTKIPAMGFHNDGSGVNRRIN